RGDLRVKAHIDADLDIEVVRAQRQPILRRAAGEIILRQIWPVDRRRGIVAEHDDAAAKLLPPEHLSRSKSCRAATDDHNLAGCIDGSPNPRLRLFAPLSDKDPVTITFDLPDCERG